MRINLHFLCATNSTNCCSRRTAKISKRLFNNNTSRVMCRLRTHRRRRLSMSLNTILFVFQVRFFRISIFILNTFCKIWTLTRPNDRLPVMICIHYKLVEKRVSRCVNSRRRRRYITVIQSVVPRDDFGFTTYISFFFCVYIYIFSKPKIDSRYNKQIHIKKMKYSNTFRALNTINILIVHFWRFIRIGTYSEYFSKVCKAGLRKSTGKIYNFLRFWRSKFQFLRKCLTNFDRFVNFKQKKRTRIMLLLFNCYLYLFIYFLLL